MRAGRRMRVRTQGARIMASAIPKVPRAPPYAASGVFPPPGGGLKPTHYSIFLNPKILSHFAKKKEDICNIYHRGALPQYTIFPA